MKKILMILTNGFDPDIRVYKEAKYLVKNGYEVEILCWDRLCCYTDKQSEKIDGIQITRFPIKSVPGSGVRKQLNPFIKYIFSIKKYVKNREYDYLHCHDLDGMITGYIACKKIKKVVFDMHEFYEKDGHRIYSFFIRKLINFLQSHTEAIIHVNEQQLTNMKEKNKKKLVWLPNYPESYKFSNIQHIESNVIRITYAGYIRHLVPLTNLAKAVNEMENILVSIHGTGEIYEQVKQLEGVYKNIKVFGKFNHDEIYKFYENSDLTYIVYNKGDKNDETALPTKFFESIITETPVIVSKQSLLEDVTRKYDIGFSVDGTDYLDIKQTLVNIQNDPIILKEKKANLEKISKDYSWENVVKVLKKIYC